jgi:hypothetical protein
MAEFAALNDAIAMNSPASPRKFKQDSRRQQLLALTAKVSSHRPH